MELFLNNKKVNFNVNKNQLDVKISESKKIINQLPIVHLIGDIKDMSKTNTKMLNLTLEDEYGDIIINKKALTGWQGDSSLNYPKKNLSIDLLEDDEVTSYKHKFINKINGVEWPTQDSFHLKANYIDSTHARNIVNANIVADMYKNKLPSKTRGVIDGFPIILYINNEKKGIYTWNLKQHRDIYGLSKKNPNHLMFRGSVHPINFNHEFLNSLEDVSDIEERHPKKYTFENLEKFNRLVDWIRNTDDKTFKEEIDQYLDKDYLIDYWLFAYVSGLVDNFGKNFNFVTYDGLKWYPTLYDLDSTWGITTYLNQKLDATAKCPGDYCSGSGSLLLERLQCTFKYEIRERYIELRQDLFDSENLKNRFRTYINRIPQSEYDDDLNINPKIYKEAELPYIEEWIDNRLAYVDSMITPEIVEIAANDFNINAQVPTSHVSTYRMCVGDTFQMFKKFFQVNSNKRELTFTSNNEDILSVDKYKITALTSGIGTIKATSGSKNKTLTFNVVDKFITDRDIITDGLIMYFDARDYDGTNEYDLTGVCPITIVGQPTKINNSLQFDGVDDGIKISNLFARCKKQGMFTIEIGFNDVDKNSGYIASVGGDYRGYGRIGVSISSQTQYIIGKTDVYTQGDTKFTRIVGATGLTAFITQGINLRDEYFNGETKHQDFNTLISDIFFIGSTNSSSYFDKTIINYVRIYNKVLTEEEMSKNIQYESTISRNL